jgi:adenylate kinase
MPSFIVLLGPPGAGKGTQAQILSKSLSLPHISSGDIFRENIKNGTELGKLAQTFMTKGELVPDDVTISMIRERLKRPDCEPGAILDGFPRTPAQAEELERMLSEFAGKVDAVPYITASEEKLVNRLSGRWTCRTAGHIYHEEFNPPIQTGVCDVDGSELYQRDDDKAETVVKRIAVYFEQTSPLIEYYRNSGQLLEINGARNILEVSQELMSALNKMEK